MLLLPVHHNTIYNWVTNNGMNDTSGMPYNVVSPKLFTIQQ